MYTQMGGLLVPVVRIRHGEQWRSVEGWAFNRAVARQVRESAAKLNCGIIACQ